MKHQALFLLRQGRMVTKLKSSNKQPLLPLIIMLCGFLASLGCLEYLRHKESIPSMALAVGIILVLIELPIIFVIIYETQYDTDKSIKSISEEQKSRIDQIYTYCDKLRDSVREKVLPTLEVILEQNKQSLEGINRLVEELIYQ